MIVNSESVHAFKDEAAFETWLAKHHAEHTEVWIKISKKTARKPPGKANIEADPARPTLTPAQAIDVALCWGWIDGIRKAYDDQAFLQRFTPRGPRSRWSQINRANVQRLTRAGRMTPAGQRQVDAAKADGRWAAAYASPKHVQVPEEARTAIQANPAAAATFDKLNRSQVYAIAYRLLHIRTPARREQTLATLIRLLEQGKSF